MTKDCPRAGRWIGGCKFEARYDKIPPSDSLVDAVSWSFSAQEIIASATKKIYIADVCTRCGKVIKREDA
ncbi:TPA: hypothetical protein QDC06_000258 [Burkholderia cepacia]|nr:hypothetical protein BZY94_06305 [Burkholderia territorii]HDR9497071.1 hypothetical protein [Burkholderia cepacia]